MSNHRAVSASRPANASSFVTIRPFKNKRIEMDHAAPITATAS